MQVMLIGKNKVHKIVLPQVAIGDYWITDKNGDFEKKLVNIKGTGEYWKIRSDKYAEVLNPEEIELNNDKIRVLDSGKTVLEEVILKEYNIYGITVGANKEFYLLCCNEKKKNKHKKQKKNKKTK